MDLFQHNAEAELRHSAPLAERMRPTNFDDFIGQDHILGSESPLRSSIENHNLPSLILWGPPGTGKTTLANILASKINAHTDHLSAVSSGVSDIRQSIKQAQQRLGEISQRTIVFIDEIHRFSKSQQDVILPFVENGTIILIGATTENPSFEVISPLLSRCKVFTLNALQTKDISIILTNALNNKKRGLGIKNFTLSNEALELISTNSNGDARWALNTLELICSYHNSSSEISLESALQVISDKPMKYDKNGDSHYDTISAYIKSIRGSDPDAAVYWLARMLESGEDLNFICRRLIILAAEDIGLADPNALSLAVACQQATNFVGLPESRIILSEISIYLATAPKSNSSYSAINLAQKEVKKSGPKPIPLHLRNPETKFLRDEGYGRDYKYPHNFKSGFVNQSYLPKDISSNKFYFPNQRGFEPELNKHIEKLRQQINEKDE